MLFYLFDFSRVEFYKICFFLACGTSVEINDSCVKPSNRENLLNVELIGIVGVHRRRLSTALNVIHKSLCLYTSV